MFTLICVILFVTTALQALHIMVDYIHTHQLITHFERGPNDKAPVEDPVNEHNVIYISARMYESYTSLHTSGATQWKLCKKFGQRNV